jgi:hypothetical protein
MDSDTQINATFLKKPKITMIPRSINFGVVEKGISSSAKLVTVINKGSAPLRINASEISGTNTNEFQQSNGCSMPLSRNATCVISVTAALTSPGTKTAELVIWSNDEKKPSLRIKLRAKTK